MDPTGKVALITGGARVGGAVAVALARRGTKLVLSYRNSKSAAQKTAERIEAFGGKVAMVQADLAQPDQVKSVVDHAAKIHGRLDILVNMASIYAKQPLAQLDAAAWDESMNAEARSAFLTSLAAAPHMKAAGAGRIINISDWLPASGRPRYKSHVPYYAGKMAVIALTQSLALELAPEILVNAIAPGPILAPPALGPEEIRKVEKATPLGRWGGADEIARAVLFLVETEFVTGECIRVDGGRHLV